MLRRAEEVAAQLPKAGETHGVTSPQPRLDIMWARLAVVALETARRDVGVATGEGAAAPLVDLAHPAACFGAGVMAFLEERGTAPRHVGMAARHDMLELWRSVQHAKAVAAAVSGRGGDGGAAAADARAQDALNRGHAWFGDADLTSVQQWCVVNNGCGASSTFWVHPHLPSPFRMRVCVLSAQL